MCFSRYFLEQLARYPKIQAQDIIKLCFQAAFGGEHIALDKDRAKAYFDGEYAATPTCDLPIFEELSNEICRVHLGAWKRESLDAEALFDLFFVSAQSFRGEDERFWAFVRQAKDVLTAKQTDETDALLARLSEFISQLDGKPRPVHHSDVYRDAYLPAYRVARTELVKAYLGER